MHIKLIDDLSRFDAERERWESLECRDPHVTMFTSWRWLRAYLPTSRFCWFILAVYQDEEAVGYLPLARAGSFLDRELYLGGNPLADYTGMIALPGLDDLVIGEFAKALCALHWDACNFRDVSDPRVDRLARLVAAHDDFRMESTDETRCRSVTLPATWDQYVHNQVTRTTRQKLVRTERKLLSLPGFRADEASSENIDAFVEALVLVKHKRWGGSLSSARRRYGRLFRNAFDGGLARIFVHWDGERPIAAAVTFIDAFRSSCGLYQTGFDEEYEAFSPGTGIVGHAMRAAIDSGYARFDFLRGDDEYKARYAPDIFVTHHYRIIRTGLRSDAIAYLRPKWFALKLLLANVAFGSGRSI